MLTPSRQLPGAIPVEVPSYEVVGSLGWSGWSKGEIRRYGKGVWLKVQAQGRLMWASCGGSLQG